MYLGWGWASAIYAWLPTWFGRSDRFEQFLFTFMIDWMMCLVPIAIVTSLWAVLLKGAIRKVRDNRKRNSPL